MSNLITIVADETSGGYWMEYQVKIQREKNVLFFWSIFHAWKAKIVCIDSLVRDLSVADMNEENSNSDLIPTVCLGYRPKLHIQTFVGTNVGVSVMSEAREFHFREILSLGKKEKRQEKTVYALSFSSDCCVFFSLFILLLPSAAGFMVMALYTYIWEICSSKCTKGGNEICLV